MVGFGRGGKEWPTNYFYVKNVKTKTKPRQAINLFLVDRSIQERKKKKKIVAKSYLCSLLYLDEQKSSIGVFGVK